MYLLCSKVRQREIALFCIYIVDSILVRALFLIQPKLVVVYDILRHHLFVDTTGS